MRAPQNEEPRSREPALEDEADKILQLHEGDGRQAIMTLLIEVDALQERLWLAKIAMGHEFAPGWKP